MSLFFIKRPNSGVASESSETSVWWSYSPIIIVALLGAWATWMVHARIADLEQQRRDGAFSEAARDRLLVVQRELDYALGLVQDIGGFFDASASVTRRQFREFVGPTLKRNPEVQALQWVPKVTREERKDFVVTARRGFSRFDILEPSADGGRVPAADRPVHYPVLMVQPYRDNADLLGLDLAADPAVLEILEAAAERGGILVSEPHSADREASDGILKAYLPVFSRDDEIEAVDVGDQEGEATSTERGALRGFAVGVFHMGGLVDKALSGLSPSGVEILFFRAPRGDDERQAFHVHRGRTPADAKRAAVTDDLPPSSTTYEGEIQVGGQTWTLLFKPVPGFFQYGSWSSQLVLGSGVVFTLLSCIYLFALIGRAQEVRRLVAQRTLELSRSNTALNAEIVERRRAERALQVLNVTLEHRVARRTTESERRARDLEQFAYVASHDLKAPLRAIANLAEWLKEDLQGKLTAETQEQFDLLRDRVARMSALIEGLLEYSRIGRTSGSVEDVDVGALVVDTVDSIAPPEGFRIEIAPGMPHLMTDRLHLGQVFANLIGNAISHHDRPQGLIRVSARDLGERYELCVEDDGPGIPPEYRDRVFMMFQTLTVKDFGSNTGIGLALVKKLVEEHGGSILLECGEDRGCRFIFTWPTREVQTDIGKHDDLQNDRDNREGRERR